MILKNVICVVVIIVSSKLNIQKKALTKRKNTYIELIFRQRQCSRLKASAKTNRCQNAKIDKNGQHQDMEPCVHDI